MKRLPRSYLGVNHQTIGSDILAVLKALHAPERVLGKAMAESLAATKPDEWYPISVMLDALEQLDAKLGTFALRNVGWELFKLSHAEATKKVASSAKDIIFALNSMYHRANRGVAIGGWDVVKFEPGRAEVEKTTPHHCVMEEGILEEALRAVGIHAEVSQTHCFRKGADSCLFVLKSAVADRRWTG